MIYDEESKKIKISVREFIMTSRRGIATSLPCDSDEPELSRIPKRIRKRILGEAEAEKITYSFNEQNYDFEITGAAEKIDGCELWFTSSVDRNPKKPKKEYTSQLRGEAYVAAYAYALKKGISRVKLSCVYINPDTEDYAQFDEEVTLEKLEKFFRKCTSAVMLFAKPEIDRVTVRLPSMEKIKFPYKEIRAGQDEFIRRAYKNIARGGVLFATAPTGTGKTVSALFPAIRALGNKKCDKVFYLTPKETTANAAIECLLLMTERGADIRAVKLRSKEKACRNGLICRDRRDNCKNSRCNRLSEAVLELYALRKTVVLAEDIDSVANNYEVCPYELSLTYSELCDVIICDFNYLFDPTVYIRRFFTEGGNYAFLIDEAHNLPERAREIYSAEISTDILSSPDTCEIIGAYSEIKKSASEASAAFREILFPYVKEELVTDEEGVKQASAHIKDVPTALYGIFDKLADACENELLQTAMAKDEEKDARLKVIRSYAFDIKKFRTALSNFNSSYELFIFQKADNITAKIFCIDPGKEISKRLTLGRSAVFFSATLTPLYYYKSILGGDGTSDTLEVDSPFDSEQLSVSIMDKISTRYSERDKTLPAVCRAIAATVSAKRGNYMIFSPSFQYSEALAREFSARYPKIKVLSQTPDMTRGAREEFLAEFSKEDKSYLIAFCVMGGIYSEGIDLAGDSLIGAVVVGIGMPGLSYEREAISAYYDEKYEEGKQFAYIYPGMNRVLQAAGRVIRREDDRGVIVLIDDRFDDPIYKKIIPKLWHGMKFIADPKELRCELDEFWKNNT